jgi:glypican 4 (K-glypican)
MQLITESTDLPTQPICDSSARCCSLADQSDLESRSRDKYVSVLRESLTGNVHEPLMRRVRQLNDHLSAGLKHSAIELHQLFRRTYGLTYDQNAALFAQLFVDLQANYNANSSKDAPDTIVNRFFTRLFVRIFRVLNAQHSFPDEYDACLADQMRSLRPFGKHPDTLASSLKRSLGAYQTFVHGLQSGKFVLAELIKEANASSTCAADLMRASDCALCSGHVGVRTCFGFCAHVMQQCLVEYAYLDSDWNTYVRAMRRLAVELDGALSVPAAIDPIAIRVSEAIMHFQENGFDITQRVFAVCGRMSSLSKRDVSGLESDSAADESNGKQRRQSGPSLGLPKSRSVVYSSDKWKLLVVEIKNELLALRNFWTRLPRNLCSDEQLVHSRKMWQTDQTLAKQCWNGSQLIDE